MKLFIPMLTQKQLLVILGPGELGPLVLGELGPLLWTDGEKRGNGKGLDRAPFNSFKMTIISLT